MINNNLTVDMKKDIIVTFLKENDNKGFSQKELTRYLMDDLMYVTESSARVSISNMMQSLHNDGVVVYKEQKPKRGRLLMKIWYLKDGIQEVS